MSTMPGTAPPLPERLKKDSYWGKLAIHHVPAQYIMVAAFVSYLIIGLSYLQGAPVWLAFGLGLAPWGAIVFFEIEWTYRHFGWLAMFSLVMFVQTIHYTEHCIQVIQVHIFHETLHNSQALFGSLAREGVHFGGDTFLTLSTLVLLYKFPRNPWLWVALPFQLLHESEHTFLFYNHVVNGVPAGAAGLLASPGGAFGGGVGLNRPDLHWIYNTLFSVPFTIALVWQLKHTYDTALDKAFTGASVSAKREASSHMETFRYRPSETVLAPGDDAERLYIITEGEANVHGVDESGQPTEVKTLHRGQYFGETALLVPGSTPTATTVRAKTDLTVMAMDVDTFRLLMASTLETPQEQQAAAGASGGGPAPLPAT